MASKFTAAVRAAIVERVSAGVSLPDAARAVGVHPSTLKGWLARGRSEEAGEHAAFAREVEQARLQVAARPGPVSDQEFRQRLEAAVRAGSVQAMALWARLYHRAGDAESVRPLSKIDELAARRQRGGAS